jgi:hypothetical protein
MKICSAPARRIARPWAIRTENHKQGRKTMRKGIITCLFCIQYACTIAAALPDTLWMKNWGGTLHDVPFDLIETHDSGFAIAGYYGQNKISKEDMVFFTRSEYLSNHVNTINSTMWVLRCDVNGDTLWTRLIDSSNGLPHASRAYAICEAPDSGFAVGGYFRRRISNTTGDFNIIKGSIVKLDMNGIVKWVNMAPHHMIGGSYADPDVHTFCWDVKYVNKDSLIGVGSLWERGYSPQLFAHTVPIELPSPYASSSTSISLRSQKTAREMLVINDNTLYAVGASGLTKYAFSGSDTWFRQYTNAYEGYSIAANNNSFFLGFDMGLIKVNQDGEEEWRKTSSEYHSGKIYAVRKLTDSTLLLCSSTGYATCIDANGTKKWSYKLPGIPTTAVLCNDGMIAIAGAFPKYYAPNDSQYNIFLCKIGMNEPPVFSKTDTIYDTVKVGETISDSLLATDSFLKDFVRYKLETIKEGLSLDSVGGIWTWTPSPMQTGSHVLMFTAHDKLNQKDTIFYSIKVDISTGVRYVSPKTAPKVFEIRSGRTPTIAVPINPDNRSLNWQVFNIQGKCISSNQIGNASPGVYEISLNPGLPAGSYVIIARFGQETKTLKSITIR